MKPRHKFNNGRGATLCHMCSVIISEGFTDHLICNNCVAKLMKKVSILSIKLIDKDKKIENLISLINQQQK